MKKPAKLKLKMNTRRKIAFFSVLGVILFLVGLRASETKAIAPVEAEEQAVTVVDKSTLQLSEAAAADLQVTKATTTNFPETLPVTGNISVVETLVTVIPARVTGRVDQVLKVTGETVKAGEALALVYSPDYLSAREEYLQTLKDSPSAATADSGLQGFHDLARKKLETMGLSPADIAALESSTGNDYLVVRASSDGVITSVNTMVGNMQNGGDTLFTTANLDRVWFSGDLYVENLPSVHIGQKVVISAEGMSQPLNGTLSFLSPVVDAAARTVKVRAIINNPDHVLRAAMFVQGHLVLQDKMALVVPQDAVLNLNDRSFCFKALGHDRFEEVPVTVTRQENNLASISQGLVNGDEVVFKDLATLDRALDSGRTRD
jgi:Cu(I)/Ag(I) efflux system membrane fusion protein